MSSGSDPTRETSDSNNQTQNSKCQKRPKGVTLQRNKNWGTQIYLDNKRYWIGTFKTEKEARMAYDSAALKLRNGNVGNSDRNFPSTNLTIHELSFQRGFTKKAVLNMIRDGSYPSKLDDYINLQGKTEQDIKKPPNSELSKIRLFEKELTPSDAGRLKRLVIPKKSALFYAPFSESNHKVQNAEPVELTFYDTSMTLWKFRYCYWESSDTFVLTRGWNKFVTAHNLQPRDTITFSKCQQQPDGNMTNAKVFYVIDVSHRNQVENDKRVEEVKDVVPLKPVSVKMEEDENGLAESKKGFKLFGETIC